MSNLTLEQLRDERDIHELLVRYCRAGDRCDAELMKSVYWPEATDEHDSFYSGNAIAFVDFALAEMRQKTLRTVHTLTNVWIQLQGDVAQVESYVNGYHLMNTPGSKVEAMVSVRFLDRMEKRRGEWRIARRKIVIDAEKDAAILFGKDALQKTLALDRRYPNDESYALFGEKS